MDRTDQLKIKDLQECNVRVDKRDAVRGVWVSMQPRNKQRMLPATSEELDDGFGPGLDVKLVVNPANMCPNGFNADTEVMGDFLEPITPRKHGRQNLMKQRITAS